MQKVGVLLMAVLLVLAAAEEDKYRGPSEEDVIVLDADNLESTIYESDETWLLELYAPWCGHCKTLRPEWAKLATKMKGIAKVAKIDASIHRKFDSVYGLKGYPHVVLIPAGRAFPTQAPRTRRSTTRTRGHAPLTASTTGPWRRSSRTRASWWRSSPTRTSGSRTASPSKCPSA